MTTCIPFGPPAVEFKIQIPCKLDIGSHDDHIFVHQKPKLSKMNVLDGFANAKTYQIMRKPKRVSLSAVGQRFVSGDLGAAWFSRGPRTLNHQIGTRELMKSLRDTH